MFRKEFNQVVAVSDDRARALILEDIFRYDDGLQGATGTEVYLMTEADLEVRQSFDELCEQYEPVWREDAGRMNGTTDSLEDWITDNLMELQDSAVELYYPEETLTSAGLSELSEVIRWGRVFYSNWRDGYTIIEPELANLIDKYEGYTTN